MVQRCRRCRVDWSEINEKVKILSTGEYTASLDIFAHKFSASSKKIIEDNGGKVNLI